MKWMGLTGGIGTGKTAVASILRTLGVPVVDADLLAHEALDQSKQVRERVVRRFGAGILGSDGRVDRARLAQKVFGDPKALSELERIIHPYVRERAAEERNKSSASGAGLAFYDVPLLFEKNLEKEFDGVVVVVCEPEVQRQRLKGRGLRDEDIELRIAAQLPLEVKAERADFIIENNRCLKDLEAAVCNLLRRLNYHAQV